MNEVRKCMLMLAATLACWNSAVAQTPRNAAPPPTSPATSDMLRGLDDALATLAEKALPAIVQINVSGYGPPEKQDGDSDGGIIERQRALGSGVIVDPSGFIMTNAHVVSGAQRIRVTVSPTLTELVPFKTSFQ